MKHIRRLTALLLCLLMTGAASSALAASKVFTAVPTLKITVPSGGIGSYKEKKITFTCSLPGFLTVHLLDPNGGVFATLYDNDEVHSKANVLEFWAVNEDESPMAHGTYTLVGTLVSQYGVASKEVSTPLKINEISWEDQDTYDELVAMREGTYVQTYDDEPAGGASATASSSSTSSSKTAAPVIVPEEVTYMAGTAVVGDEGWQIGVGVSDVAEQANAGYWGLTAEATDAEIWAALTRPMVAVDVGEQESAYIYNSVKEGRKKLGAVSGISQGLNLITERNDGWSLVEAYRKEDGAFIRGYIRSNKLRTVEPNMNYGLVIDKKAQTLIVYKDGVRLGSCSVSTGLATPKYLHRETPAGEYIIATRRGTTEYYGQGFSKYTMRINGSYYLSEIPTTRKNGSDYSILESYLGQKATRGNICIAQEPSVDGGINAKWIWEMSDANRKAKVLIFDDKNRSDIPVGQ